ncbi:MAG: FAD-dependent oxidoreductase [bacterium]
MATNRIIPTSGIASCANNVDADVFVYGSTPGGIAAGLEAARDGLRVVLACPKMHPGGMTASGLSTTDAVRRHLFGGIVIEFIERIREHYLERLGEHHPEWSLCQDGWYYEPSVAEAVFREMMEAEPNLRWFPGHWLTTVTVTAGTIQSVTLEPMTGGGSGNTEVAASIFIDATYEGDLAAAAGVPYRVGREGREEYGESLAGIHYMNWKTRREIETPMSGEPSNAIQAYCARCIVTDDPAHRLPIDKPDSYDQHLPDYLPLIEDFKSGRITTIYPIFWGTRLPRGKIQVNGNIESMTSINCPGVSWPYPEAGRRMREALDRFHVEHAWGLLWFLQNDPHVPPAIATQARTLGLHDQEFMDSGHWPWQIYIRQARRIEGRATVTQHNFVPDPETGTTPQIEGAVALAEHSFDVHPCHDRRWAIGPFMEGVLWYRDKARGPAQPGQIPYGAMLPRNVDNLLVPVAMSSTHVAMSVLRMEPVWMTTGQIAGKAAACAIAQKTNPANVDPSSLSVHGLTGSLAINRR